MAESGTSRQRTKEQQRGSQAQGGSSENQRGGIQRGENQQRQVSGRNPESGGYVPSVFSLSPRDFFTSSPLGLMRRFADEMDRVFSNLGASGQRNATGEELAWMPVVEVRENDNQLIVNAELPGLTDKDVRVETTPEGLVIQGERQREYSSDEGGFQRSERSYGRFWRLIPLPEDAKWNRRRRTSKTECCRSPFRFRNRSSSGGRSPSAAAELAAEASRAAVSERARLRRAAEYGGSVLRLYRVTWKLEEVISQRMAGAQAKLRARRSVFACAGWSGLVCSRPIANDHLKAKFPSPFKPTSLPARYFIAMTPLSLQVRSRTCPSDMPSRISWMRARLPTPKPCPLLPVLRAENTTRSSWAAGRTGSLPRLPSPRRAAPFY